jgi:hypothetical protein
VAVPCPDATASTGSPAPLSDTQVVFCLSTEQRPRLADAAVALELVETGSTPERVRIPVPAGEPTAVDLPTWRRIRPADFARACTALTGGTPSAGGTSAGGTSAGVTSAGVTSAGVTSGNRSTTEPTGGWLRSTVSVLLPLLFGALLTSGTSRRQRAAELAEVLRSRVRDLAEASREWVDDPSGSGRETLRDTRLHELRTCLDRVRAARRRWTLPPALADLRHGDGDLVAAFRGMNVLPPGEASRRREALDQGLKGLHEAGELVAQALEHPFRPHRQLRRTV